MMVGLVMAVGIAPAGASTTSTVVPGTASLRDVACPTASTCVAVGQSSNPTQGVVAAVSVTSAGVTPGGVHAVPGTLALVGVACPTASTCVAVGTSSSEGVVVPLSVTANDVTPGAVQSVPGAGNLNGVACPTAGTCVAVGQRSSPTQGVVVPVSVTTSGVSSGDAQAAPGTFLLSGVTCPVAETCLAVGQTSPATGVALLLDVTSNGVTPGGAQSVAGTGSLGRVACSSAATCLAAAATSGLVPLTVTSGGVAPGTVQAVPGSFAMNGVACPSAGTCLAAGYSQSIESGAQVLNGLVVPASITSSGVSLGGTQAVPETQILFGVGCPTATTCIVVGQNNFGGQGVVASIPVASSAADQLAALSQAVQGIGPGNSLASKVANAQAQLARGNTAAACGTLGAFLNQVRAQSGNHIPPDTAAQLINAAQSIREGLGC